MQILHIRCLVACRQADGTPALWPVIVRCTQLQFENGEHYEVARNVAAEFGYEVQDYAVVFDENDMSPELERIFDWNNVVTTFADLLS